MGAWRTENHLHDPDEESVATNQQNGKTCEPDIYEANDIFEVDFAHRQWTGLGQEILHKTVDDVNNNLPYANKNFSADPQLDATFHLQNGSACIDAGDRTALAATLSRLLRIGEKSLHEIWDLQDYSI